MKSSPSKGLNMVSVMKICLFVCFLNLSVKSEMASVVLRHNLNMSLLKVDSQDKQKHAEELQRSLRT